MEEHKDEVLASIRKFYEDGSSYGSLSQRLHGLQAARQAVLAGAPKEVVVGALLHDIGWKLARQVPNAESSMENESKTMYVRARARLYRGANGNSDALRDSRGRGFGAASRSARRDRWDVAAHGGLR